MAHSPLAVHRGGGRVRICAEADDVEGVAEHRARAAELAPGTFYAGAAGATAE